MSNEHYDIITSATDDMKVEFILREHDIHDDYTVTIVDGRLRVTWGEGYGYRTVWEFKGPEAKKIQVGFDED